MNANNIYLKVKKNTSKKTNIFLSILIGLISLALIFSTISLVHAHDENNHPAGKLMISKADTGLDVRVEAPLNHRVASAGAVVIDDMDCDADQTFTDLASIATPNARLSAKATHATTSYNDKYLCVEVVYSQADSSNTTHYLISEKLDGTGPMVDDTTIKGGTYNYESVGKKLVLNVNFDETVKVVRTAVGTEKPTITVATDYLEFKLVANDKGADDDVIASGTTLKFEAILTYNHGYKELDEDDIDAGTQDWTGIELQDSIGNVTDPTTGTGLTLDTDNVDFTIDMTPMVPIDRDGRTLKVMATPSMYAATGDVKDDATVTWQYREAAMRQTDSCQEADANGASDDDDYVGALTAATDGEVTLPEDPNGHYYCFTGTLADLDTTDTDVTGWEGRDGDDMISTVWYHYTADTTDPSLTLQTNTAGTMLEITAHDASGIKSVMWKPLNAATDLCTKETVTSVDETVDLTADSEDPNRKTGSITIRQDLKGVWICVKATDGLDQRTAKKVQLGVQTMMDDDDTDDDSTPPTTVDPDDEPVTDDPSVTPTDDDSAPTPTVGSVTLPDNWDTLSVAEKIRLNPYKCLDTTKIRGDNGMCLSGGSALTAEDTTPPADETTPTDPVDDTTPVDEPTPPVDEPPTADPVDETTVPVDDTTPVDGETPTEPTTEPTTPTDDATTTDDGTTTDEGGSSVVWIIIIVVAIIAVIGIVVVASKKGNNQI